MEDWSSVMPACGSALRGGTCPGAQQRTAEHRQAGPSRGWTLPLASPGRIKLKLVGFHILE